MSSLGICFALSLEKKTIGKTAKNSESLTYHTSCLLPATRWAGSNLAFSLMVGVKYRGEPKLAADGAKLNFWDSNVRRNCGLAWRIMEDAD